MSQEKDINQAEKMNPEEDAPELSPEILDKIKHPPNIEDVLRELPKEELRGMPGVVPEMLDEPNDEMIGLG
jgi:hypothetical protein